LRTLTYLCVPGDTEGDTPAHLHWRAVGGWYWIGVAIGFGVAIGVFAGGVLGSSALWTGVAVLIGAVLGALAGWELGGWGEIVGGAVGGIAGAAAAGRLLQGALRTGGTRGGTAVLLGVAAVVLAALALVPALGYVELVAVPALAVRLRRRTPERYAGLRSLAD
jgi:hypothetical protein